MTFRLPFSQQDCEKIVDLLQKLDTEDSSVSKKCSETEDQVEVKTLLGLEIVITTTTREGKF